MAAPANTRRAASDVSSSPVRSPTADREIDETFLPQDEDGEGEGEGNDENNHDDNTAYSIDFDALVGGSGGGRRRGGHPDHDDDLTLDDTEPFDTLRSEDVDGPSDFTQNMEFWMRSKFSPPQAQQQRGKKVANADPGATPATAAGRIERDDGGDDENEGVVGNDDTLPPTRTPTESFDTQRDHVSDSEGEGEGGDMGKEGEEEEGEHEGSFEYRQSENENTHEIAAAAMRDLNGYVISDEDTFLPPTSQPGSTADEHDGNRGERSRSGSIDEQIDILSSMDEGVEEEYRSVSASPALAQGEWRTERRTPSVVQRASWLQPTVEDHEDTPPLSARPSPRNGIGKSPEVWLGAYEEKLPKQRRMESISTASPRPTLRNHPRYTPRKVSEEDVDDLRAQIRRLQAELERQCGDFTAKIANLESQLQRTRNERDEARENEQQRVRDLNSQYDERAQDLEEHWQRRLATAQERYEQDVQEQKASFALVKSSFESRLAATESGLQAQLARKEAELDAVKEASKQELEQQRAGNDAKVATLEERIKELESSQQQQASEGTSVHATPSSAINQALTQQKAESDARIAELEARLSTTQSQLEAARTSSPEAALSDTMRLADERRQTDDLLARSRQQIADLEANLQLLQSQLALARRETDEMRRAADTAREGARVLRSELGRAQELVEERGRRLEEVAREHEADTDMAERARRDAERVLEERVRAAERKAKVLLERKVAEKESEVGDMRKRAETAVRKAQTMLNGERIEKAGLRRALEGLKEEVEGLRRQVEERKKDSSGAAAAAASSSTSPSNHHPSPDAAEEIIRSRDDGDDNTTSPRSSELELLRRALRDATTATKEAREDARRAREESAALREDFAEVNRAMDERVVRLVRAREKEWRGKVEALAAEKRALGRALLHEWGREEVGEGEPQAYRYKYVERKESGGEKKGRGKA